jgi:hypothetical protein
MNPRHALLALVGGSLERAGQGEIGINAAGQIRLFGGLEGVDQNREVTALLDQILGFLQDQLVEVLGDRGGRLQAEFIEIIPIRKKADSSPAATSLIGLTFGVG